jgi:uncharacterized protein
MLQKPVPERLFFQSGAARCAADLYLPSRPAGRMPCVVMGHGFSGTKDFAIPAFAREFARHGFVALAFDYRNFGDSEGKPRQVVHIDQQRDDFRAAIRLARNLDNVDPDRIALWGASLAGGHVLTVASSDSRIAAIIALVPFIDAFEGGALERVPIGVHCKLLLAAVYDTVRGWLGMTPYLVPVIGKPGSFAAMTEPEAKNVADALGAEGSIWRNAFAPRVAFKLPRYRKGTIESIQAPILFCIADNDIQASPEFAVRIAAQNPRTEVRRYPVGHFGVYIGDMRDKVIADQLDFLTRHLASID